MGRLLLLSTALALATASFARAEGGIDENAGSRLPEIQTALGRFRASRRPADSAFPSSLARKYPIRGIDVSHHQGAIAWDKVRREGVRFAYIKATEGGDHKDPRFLRNWQEAGQAGVARGAYHYFSFCSPGEAQADNYISVVPKEEGALPPVIDVEPVGNCTARPDKERLLEELAVFVRRIEEAYGRRPVFYTLPAFHRRYLSGEDRLLWLRSGVEPRLPEGAPTWTFWQRSGTGSVAGIEGPVDMDVFNGDEQAFTSFIGRP
ncbi:MAG: GH25 family lysozyme [Elusimicrobiota bacterium]|jgi:lysozyme